MMLERRELLGGAVAAAGVGAGLAAPAVAQTAPEIRWRLTSSFPKSLDTIFGAAQVFARLVGEMSDQRFQIQVFAPGEIVPGLQALDAVSAGTVECAHSSSYYYVGKDPTFAMATAVPFGLNSRMQTAWLEVAGGMQLFNEFYEPYNVHALTMGNTGTQMGGWFRREIKGTADLEGLKFRIAGIAGRVLGRLGVVPQQIAGGDVYPALEKGTLDAAEWVGPYDDERLGFVKVAKFYYYPGFWEGGPALHLFINKAKWEELSPAYKAMVTAASNQAAVFMQAKYDQLNPPAIRRLVAAGAQLRPFPQEVLDASLEAANAVYGEIGAQNASFKRIHDHMTAFRNDQYLWWQVAEFSNDGLMIRSRGRG